MKELLVEFLSKILYEYSDEEKKRMGIPPGAESRGGKWYDGDDYVGRVEDGKFVKATAAEKKAEKQKGGTQVTQPPTRQPKGQSEKPTIVSAAIERAREAFTSLYGRNGKGKLLTGSESAQNILDNGFNPGKGAPPGNAGSNFNENMSNEGVKILELNPDMDEETLARIIFERTRNTALGAQQKDTSIMGQAGLPLPDDIRKMSAQDQQRILYKNCVIVARSARQKFDRARQSAEAASKNGFGTSYEHLAFGGAKSDLAAVRDIIEKAPRIFIHDEELGVIEVPKETMLEWVAASGGGENAADTMILTVDKKGNVVYDGWSDKKTLKDIQGNSTLNEEYTGMSDTVASLQEDGAIDNDDAQDALGVLQGAQAQSDAIEAGYSDVSRTLSNYFIGRKKDLNRYGEMARAQKETSKHYANWLLKLKAVTDGTAKSSKANSAIRTALAEGAKLKLKGEALAFYVLCKVAQDGLLTADDRKILERTAAAERKNLSAKSGELPAEHRGLDVEDALSDLRDQVLDLQRDTVKQLNRITATTRSGKKVKLGNLLKSREIISFLHLDKIDMPTGKNDHRQILRRNTQLILEGIPVSPKKLRSCLTVDTTKEFEDNFEVVFDDEDANTVYVYAINRQGKRVLIAKKVYRSKTGLTGATGTTVEWTKEMQRCFDAKD